MSPRAIELQLVGLCTVLEMQIPQLTADPWSKGMENMVKWAMEAASDPSVAESVGNWVRAFTNQRSRAMSTGNPKPLDHGERREDKPPILGSRDVGTQAKVEDSTANENNYGTNMHGTSQPSSPGSVCTNPELAAEPNPNQSRPFSANTRNPGGQGIPNPSKESIYDSSRHQLGQTLQHASYQHGLPQDPDPRIHRQQDPQVPHYQLPHPQQVLHFPQMHMPHMPPYLCAQPRPPIPVWPYGSPAYWQQTQQQQRQLQQSLPPHLQRPQQLPQAHNQPIQSTARIPNQSAQPAPPGPIPPKPVAAPVLTPTSTAQIVHELSHDKPAAKASTTTPTPKPPTSSVIPPAAGGVTNQPTPTDSADGGADLTGGGASPGPMAVTEPVVGTGTATRGKGKGGGRGRGKPKV